MGTMKMSRLSEAIGGVVAPCANASARFLFAGCLLGCLSQANASIYVVDTTGDPGPPGSTSLRQALLGAQTSAGNVVKFDAALIGSTVTLTQGAITLSQAGVTIEGRGSRAITISGNDASGIFIVQGAPGYRNNLSVSGVTLTHGYLPANVLVAGGGAILGKYANVALDDVTITHSNTTGYGGAVHVVAANLTIRNSRITGNNADSGGGAIATFKNGDGTRNNVYIYDSTISGNTTFHQGGGIYGTGGNIFRVNRSLIANNTINAPRGGSDVQGGGGIALKDIYQETTITNSTISGNFTYAAGGGLSFLDATTSNHATLRFSTIANNYGGYHESSNGLHCAGMITLNSTIIAGNSNRGDTIDVDGSLFATHSLIGNAQGAAISGNANIFGMDPQLGPLKDNGGPTLTTMPAATSPAIGAADSTTGIVIDQRSQPRSTGPFSAGNDIGAVETQLVEDLIFRDNFEFY